MSEHIERPYMASKLVRFMTKVRVNHEDTNACWHWIGAGKGNGYGSFVWDGNATQAHRAAYMLFRGEIPEGHDVCHSCDNRSCVNPDHLFTGTRKRNMEDCAAKGRTTGFHRKHLKEFQVQEVRRRLNTGLTARQVSKQMGIAYITVNSIKKGKTYGRFSQ